MKRDSTAPLLEHVAPDSSARSKYLRSCAFQEAKEDGSSRTAERFESLTSKDVEGRGGIEQNAAALGEAPQRRAIVQPRPLRQEDERIIAALQKRGGIVPCKTLATDARISRAVAEARLYRMICDGLVRSIPGRGYELCEASR